MLRIKEDILGQPFLLIIDVWESLFLTLLNSRRVVGLIKESVSDNLNGYFHVLAATGSVWGTVREELIEAMSLSISRVVSSLTREEAFDSSRGTTGRYLAVTNGEINPKMEENRKFRYWNHQEAGI